MTSQAVTVNAPWEEVAEVIEFVPAEYSEKTRPQGAAQEMLRCGPGDIEALVGAGLPYEWRSGVRYFDVNDLYNLGMYSGRGNTQPELAFRMLFRFAGRSVEALLRPKVWDFRVRFDCAECGGAAPWRFEGPDIERFRAAGYRAEAKRG